MFVYYGYLIPLSRRIRRGFYADGIWSDTGFIRYNEVGGLSWREGEHSVSLILISRLRNLARRLSVPPEHYGAARRLLRDKIGDREIHFSGVGLISGHRMNAIRRELESEVGSLPDFRLQTSDFRLPSSASVGSKQWRQRAS